MAELEALLAGVGAVHVAGLGWDLEGTMRGTLAVCMAGCALELDGGTESSTPSMALLPGSVALLQWGCHARMEAGYREGQQLSVHTQGSVDHLVPVDMACGPGYCFTCDCGPDGTARLAGGRGPCDAVLVMRALTMSRACAWSAPKVSASRPRSVQALQ